MTTENSGFLRGKKNRSKAKQQDYLKTRKKSYIIEKAKNKCTPFIKKTIKRKEKIIRKEGNKGRERERYKKRKNVTRKRENYP